MAETKAKVKRMGELQSDTSGPEETSEILKPVRTVTDEEMKNLEDHDMVPAITSPAVVWAGTWYTPIRVMRRRSRPLSRRP